MAESPLIGGYFRSTKKALTRRPSKEIVQLGRRRIPAAAASVLFSAEADAVFFCKSD